jgi:hypothetical protein
MDLSLARDDMISHSEGDPARALEKAKCVWDKGLTDLTRRISKDTELKSNILVDSSPYPPTPEWIHYSSNALSVPTFSLADPAALSKFKSDGFDYVVVPQDLTVRSSVGKGRSKIISPMNSYIPVREELYFETPVAVVDLKKNAVIWTGVVSSARHSLEIHTSSVIERETYDWLYDLLAVLGRNMREPSARFQACK